MFELSPFSSLIKYFLPIFGGIATVVLVQEVDPASTWSSLLEFGFPVAVSVYLLTSQARQLQKHTLALYEVKLGLKLILSKMDAIDDYDKLVATMSHDGADHV